jgi:hypothetical protein
LEALAHHNDFFTKIKNQCHEAATENITKTTADTLANLIDPTMPQSNERINNLPKNSKHYFMKYALNNCSYAYHINFTREHPICAVGLSDSTDVVAIATTAPSLLLWNLLTGRPIIQLNTMNIIHGIMFNNTGSHICTIEKDENGYFLNDRDINLKNPLLIPLPPCEQTFANYDRRNGRCLIIQTKKYIADNVYTEIKWDLQTNTCVSSKEVVYEQKNTELSSIIKTNKYTAPKPSSDNCTIAVTKIKGCGPFYACKQAIENSSSGDKRLYVKIITSSLFNQATLFEQQIIGQNIVEKQKGSISKNSTPHQLTMY